MIWVYTIGFFIAYIPLIWIAFEVYAYLLRKFAKLSKSMKNVIGAPIYLAFAAFLASPFLLGIYFIPGADKAVPNASWYFYYYLVLYLICVLPGILSFRKRHLDRLREIGYFTQ